MQFDRRHILAAGLAALCCLGSTPVLAQGTYPAKPITVVVAYPPGGDTDAIARLFSDKLSQKLKQPVADRPQGRPAAPASNYLQSEAMMARARLPSSARPLSSSTSRSPFSLIRATRNPSSITRI